MWYRHCPLVCYYPAVFRTVGEWALLAPAADHSRFAGLDHPLSGGGGSAVFSRVPATTMPVFKRNTRYVPSFASISTLYLLYASKDPAQIYNMFISEYIRLGISNYISGALPALGWIILGLCTVFFVVLGLQLVRYTQLTYDDTRQDMILKRKFDAAGTGVSVFVHGVKNQLLSSRVLHKKLSGLWRGPSDMAQVRACAVQLNELNEGMSCGGWTSSTAPSRTTPLPSRPCRWRGWWRRRWSGFTAVPPGQPVRLDVGTDRLVLADLSHLSEAVCNLLCNGYEAAVQAGREEPQVVLRVRAERMWTVLEVEDNGRASRRSARARFFEPLCHQQNTNYNWGMGLYYVRKIVRSHLGRLRLESRDGEGARFQIMLPLYDPRQKGDHTMAKTIRVMVAGGLPPAAGGLLRRGLRPERYGGGGLRRLRRREIASLADTVPCDVILMDIEMETIDAGIRAAEVITARHPEVKILFLTAHETDDMITSAMGTGAVDYVVKGCEEERLLEHIRRASEGRAELDPKIQNTVMQEYARLRRGERSPDFLHQQRGPPDAGGHEAGQAAAPGQEGGGDRQAPLRGGGDH